MSESSLSPSLEAQLRPARASSQPWVLGATMATILIAAVEGTIIATVLPTIVGKLGGFAYLSWAFTAYLLT